MIQFNELRMTDDGKHLIIEALVPAGSAYDDVTIQSISIDTDTSFVSADMPSVETYEHTVNSLDTLIPGKTYNYPTLGSTDDPVLTVRVVVETDLLLDRMFFVYIKTSEPSADAPCGLRDTINMGVAYNNALLYQYSMSLLNSIEGCSYPRHIIDQMLRLHAFKLCLETGNITKAIEYWNVFYKGNKRSVTTKPCGCNG